MSGDVMVNGHSISKSYQIKSGDKIVEINQQSILGITLEEAVDKMRGKAGSKINVGIVREGWEGVKQYTLKREVIKFNPGIALSSAPAAVMQKACDRSAPPGAA